MPELAEMLRTDTLIVEPVEHGSWEAARTKQLSWSEFVVWLILAIGATFFTNLEPVPLCAIASSLCQLVLVERLKRVASFVVVLMLVGLSMGASTYGYLSGASFGICILAQLPLSAAFLCHRRHSGLNPSSFLATLSFPCVTTALFVVSMYTLPIGSTASPAYSMLDLRFVLQSVSMFGRSFVTFLVGWTAACGARCIVAGFQHAPRKALAACGLTWLLTILGGGVRIYAPHMFQDIHDWDGADSSQRHHVSCLSGRLSDSDVYHRTKMRLDAGDTIVIHSERNSQVDDDVPVGLLTSKYSTLLSASYNKSGIEAVVLLSFVKDGKSWYHLVSRTGSVMSYAKNHPVPFVENDIVGGESPPAKAIVSVGSELSAGRRLVVTGSICFDTDFPWLTRRLGGADLWLETSETWYNIGEEHFFGHKLVAIENGVTLIKCTDNGVTGAFDPWGNVLYQAPQTVGTTSFTIPIVKGSRGTPVGGLVFDLLVCIAAMLSLGRACCAKPFPPQS